MPLGIGPTVDYAFKRLFGDPQIKAPLLHLLNSVLKPKSPIVQVEILNPFNEKEFEEDKLSNLDIKACDARRSWFNIEMQSKSQGILRKRLPYYNSLLYVDQLSEGQDYHLLLPAISICFLKERLFTQTSEPHLCFTLNDYRHGVQLSDVLQIHTVELAKYNFPEEAATISQADGLDQWAYFLSRAGEHEAGDLMTMLPAPEFAIATGVIEMISRNAEQRMQYEARRKAELDFRSFVAEAREEGLEKGRVEGREEGISLGEARGLKTGMTDQIHLLEKLLQLPLTPKETLMEMELPALTELRDSLERRLTTPS